MNSNETLDNQEIIVTDEEEIEKLKQSLPKASLMSSKIELSKYQGFWHASGQTINNALMFQTHFRAQDTDLIIVSHPKTGTTWLKSLLFSVVNRKKYTANNTPLLRNNPHELVYRLEDGIYGEAFAYPQPHDLDELPSPRLFQTHFPYTSLPESIKNSKCRILYVSRNPLDTFVSQWKFYPKVIEKVSTTLMGEVFVLPSIEQYFEDFYQGKIPYGPFFDHVLEYWNESLERPNKVLFLKFEDLKDDSISQLKILADFIGYPFSQLEENEGVINEMIELCSISKLKGLEVNKNGVHDKFYENNSFFRKGEIGDWANYFTPSMVAKLKLLMDEKFKDTGLSFKITSQINDQ